MIDQHAGKFIEENERVVGVIEATLLALKTEKVIEFMGTEVELNAEFGLFQKKRMIEVRKSPEMCDCLSLDLTVSFRAFRDGRETVNEAEVFLLPEELPPFIQAFIQHPILLPTNYSQHLSIERGMYCIRLTSEEPFEDFADRLSETLSRIR